MLYVENMRTDGIGDPRLLDLEFLRPNVMVTENLGNGVVGDGFANHFA